MKRFKAKVDSLQRIKKDVFLLRFSSKYLATNTLPGQFIHLKIEAKSLLLRRPFSIHKIEKDTITILFRVRGKGTKILSEKRKGDSLDIVGPLGKGFDYADLASKKKEIFLVAGGMGVAPLVFLAQRLKVTGTVLVGAATKKEIIGKQEFEKLGCKVMLATEDGSSGFKGTVIDLLKKTLSKTKAAQVYACGPHEMLAGLAKVIRGRRRVTAQVSFEQFMGCGIGVCRACVIKTHKGYRRICKEGPVFHAMEVF